MFGHDHAGLVLPPSEQERIEAEAARIVLNEHNRRNRDPIR